MAYVIEAAVAVVAGNSDDEGNSDEQEEHMIDFVEHILLEVADHTRQKRPEVDNEYYMRPHTVDTVFDDHYLYNLAANRSLAQLRGPVRPPFVIASDSWLVQLHNSSW